jgi:hypothetical protein
VVVLLIRTINHVGARVAAFASKYINKKRIEEEPIAPLGEFVAALVFAGVVAYGLARIIHQKLAGAEQTVEIV